jgi:protein-tyrosine phosphatase
MLGKTQFVIEATKNNITIHHLGFLDRKACNMEHFINIINLLTNLSSKNKFLVHCLGGIGRTNMILAGYLMFKQNISPSEAIVMLKRKRKVIMTPEQIMFLKSYYGLICNNFMESNTLNGQYTLNGQFKPIPKV